VTITSLKIGTWNILGRRLRWGDQKPAEPGRVKCTLAKHSLDVLSLQEVHFYDEQPDQQLLDELSEVGLSHFTGQPLSDSHLDAAAQLGVGVASRYPLSSADTIKLTRPDLRASVRGQLWVLHDKGMVGCALEVGGDRRVWICSLHLFPFFEFGVSEDDNQVEQMWKEFWGHADRLADRGDLVLAGDFNHQNREQAAGRWSSRQWRFCFNTAPTTSNGHALDEIALSWSPPAPHAILVQTFSDHHLAIADVELRSDAVRDQSRGSQLRKVAAG
jgi:endonuclease/exonuclease/phosphatase family metal-dependent hydrolase